MILKNHFQNAYVTRNLDKAVELMKSRYGIEEFIHFEPDIEMITPDGPRRSVTRAALGWVDSGLMIELIQPVSGAVDIYSGFLPEDDSPRFHHVAMRTDNWNQTLEFLQQGGWKIAAEHHMAEGLNFVYVDARDTLGHYLEYIWATPEMWQAIGGLTERVDNLV